MSDLDINVEYCRRRQQRLLAVMHEMKLDLVIVQTAEHVQWLAGPRFAWLVQGAATLWADGRCTLVAPQDEPVTAADEVVTYDARWLGTLRNDQRHACSLALAKQLAGKAKGKRVGVEFSCFAPSLANELSETEKGTGTFCRNGPEGASHKTYPSPFPSAQFVDIEPDLYRLRRRKEPDELARLKKAIAATGKMYERARQMIEPGVNELDVFDELQAVAVEEFGEMLTGTGNDYACGEKGGPPRNRRAKDGELYILDLGPAFRGYFADNCRAVAVNRQPTDKQHAAWERLAAVFPMLEQTVKPGVSCREFYAQVKSHLDEFMPGSFDHHLGHGIGLFPHEGPHLNPKWDDHFEEGDVFTAEPGLYSPELRAGIRLENDYLVTATGVECLSPFPLDL